jgi:hypothetical protein
MYAVAIIGMLVFGGVAGVAFYFYHIRTKDLLNRYEKMIEDMFDRKMAQGNYEIYCYGKGVKNKQQIVQFLDELEKNREDKQIPLQMESNR